MAIQVLSFNCLLKNAAGRVLGSTYNRNVLNTIEDEPVLLRGLCQGLQNLKSGEVRQIHVKAQEAYGLYDPAKVILYPRKMVPPSTQVGETIGILSKSGVLRHYQVLEFFSAMVRLDGNHPLAGQDLLFEVEVLEARPATQTELRQVQSRMSHQLLH